MKNTYIDYFADFETTTNKNFEIDGETRVLAWGLMSELNDKFRHGSDLAEFLDVLVSETSEIFSPRVWFHNLKFDFSFIENYFLEKDIAAQSTFKNVKFSTKGKEYTALRDQMGNLYSVTWYLSKDKYITFCDSLKVFPTSLAKLGETIGVPKLKGDMDFDRYFPFNYKLTEKELGYLHNDVLIVKKAVSKQIAEDGFRLTRSSYAFNKLQELYNANFEKTYLEGSEEYDYYEKGKIVAALTRHGNKKDKTPPSPFDVMFPATHLDDYVKMSNAYSGGFVYVNPVFANKITTKGFAYDINSSYPSQMASRELPYGTPKEFDGCYFELSDKEKETYPLFIQNFTADFRLKKESLPVLSKKFSKYNDLIYDSADVACEISLSNVDLEHFFKNYEVSNITWRGGYMFRSTTAPFKNFIDFYIAEKIEGKKTKDEWRTMQAKLTMNSSYGKFAQSPFTSVKVAHLEEGVTKYTIERLEPEVKNYLPVAIFTTAYARDTLFEMIYRVGISNFRYCDTDSVHFVAPEDGEIDLSDLEDPFTLGKWDREMEFVSAKFLRNKCYIEEYETPQGIRYNLKAAGLSDQCKNELLGTLFDKDGKITGYSKTREEIYEELNFGNKFKGNTMVKQVRGGCLIVPVIKELRKDNKQTLVINPITGEEFDMCFE